MNLDEYVGRKTGITQRVARLVLRLLSPFLRPRLSRADWETLMFILYPHVEQGRYESAQLGREFFDSQREQNIGERLDVFLAGYEREWFKEAMEPSYARIVVENAREDAAVDLINRVVKEVENGGRKTLIRAVQSDQRAVGWARYDPIPPTCAFCTMLISRGPVYLSAKTAGLNTDDATAEQLFAAKNQQALDALATRFHPGCTCAVIPVYDEDNWEGRDQYLAAEKLWRSATRGYSGLDALNALRRALGDDRREDQTALPTAA